MGSKIKICERWSNQRLPAVVNHIPLCPLLAQLPVCDGIWVSISQVCNVPTSRA